MTLLEKKCYDDVITTDTFEKCDLHQSFWIKISQSEIWLFLLSADSSVDFAYYYKAEWIWDKIGIFQPADPVKIIYQLN